MTINTTPLNQPDMPVGPSMADEGVSPPPTLWGHRLLAWVFDIGAALTSLIGLVLLLVVREGGGNLSVWISVLVYPALCVWSLTSAGATPGQRLVSAGFGVKPSVGRAIAYTVLRPVVGPLDVFSVGLSKRSIGDQMIGAELRRELATGETGRRWRARVIDLVVAGFAVGIGFQLVGYSVSTASGNLWAARAFEEACTRTRVLTSGELMEPTMSDALLEAAGSCLSGRGEGWRSYVSLMVETMPVGLKFAALLVLAVIVLIPFAMIRSGGRTAGQRLVEAPEVPSNLSSMRLTALVTWRLAPLLVLPLVIVFPVWLVGAAVVASIVEPIVRAGDSVSDGLRSPGE